MKTIAAAFMITVSSMRAAINSETGLRQSIERPKSPVRARLAHFRYWR